MKNTLVVVALAMAFPLANEASILKLDSAGGLPTDNNISRDYEKLKSLYENAEKPASLSDFTPITEVTDMLCSGSEGSGSPARDLGLAPRTFTYVVKPGRPPMGPALPRVPDKTRTDLAFWPYDAVESYTLPPKFRSDANEKDLFIKTDDSTVYFRKAISGWIAVKATYKNGDPAMYGYCWRETKICTFHSTNPSPYLRWMTVWTKQNTEHLNDLAVIADGSKFLIERDGLVVTVKSGDDLSKYPHVYQAKILENPEKQLGVKNALMAPVGSRVWINKDVNTGTFDCE